jgi:hypothetical protein
MSQHAPVSSNTHAGATDDDTQQQHALPPAVISPESSAERATTNDTSCRRHVRIRMTFGRKKKLRTVLQSMGQDEFTRIVCEAFPPLSHFHAEYDDGCWIESSDDLADCLNSTCFADDPSRKIELDIIDDDDMSSTVTPTVTATKRSIAAVSSSSSSSSSIVAPAAKRIKLVTTGALVDSHGKVQTGTAYVPHPHLGHFPIQIRTLHKVMWALEFVGRPLSASVLRTHLPGW